MHILLVEDDPMVAESIVDGMGQHGISVVHAKNAAVARAALIDHPYDVVILDIGLPGESGMTVLDFLRERYDNTAVIMLTARGQLTDRIRGLDAGADDYLIKPFVLGELLARTRAVVRRTRGRVIGRLKRGNLCLDPVNRQVHLDEHLVTLSTHEFKVLLCLMERAGQVVTRSMIESALYGTDEFTESNTVAYFIHQLRRKLGSDVIKTLHGQGYTMGLDA